VPNTYPSIPYNSVFFFLSYVVSYNALSGTRNAITPKKADNTALHGWWKYWSRQGKFFWKGEVSKIKDQDWQKIFDLYSAGIFSGISFEMQNGLPSRMYELSITQGVSDSFQLPIAQGVPDIFQVATEQDPSNYEVNDDVVPGITQLATSQASSNYSNEEIDNNDNSDPFQCDIMPSSSDEDDTASIKYLKRNLDPSLK
jgi:hypothetical protein